MTEQFHYLFTPIKLGPVTVRNRIVSTPHGTKLSANGMPTERLAYYHAERAKGGAGLIEIEGTQAAPEERVFVTGQHMRGYAEACIPGFQRIAEMVHEHGAKVFCEIQHLAGWTGRSASPVPDLWSRTTPRPVTVEEIKSWIMYYAISARNMREAGIDGVEVHASHSSGLHQFNSPLYNRRTDSYGGSLEKRLTFLLETIDAIRAEVGNDLALGVRLNVEEPWPAGVTLEEGKRMAQLIEATGKVDYLSVDAAIEPHQGHIMTAPLYAPQGHMVYCAAAVREVVDIPVLAAGRIVDPLHAEKILADGHADLVAMTRAQIADPELANKAREGRLDDIRPCLGDNENCIGRTMTGVSIACTGNPAAGEEEDLGIGTLQPAPVKKVVLVIGGGPAGMEAARTAALRGHRVVLYEKEEVLGGQVTLAARLPGREEIDGIIRWLKGQLAKLDIEVRLGEEFTAAKLDEIRPDAVVVATGATFFRDGTSAQTFRPIPGWEHENVTTPEEILSGRKEAGQRVILVDETGFLVGAGIGELLADQGKSVELLTSDPYFGTYLVTNQQIPWVYARIMGKVTLTPNTVVKEIVGSTVVTINPHSRQEGRIDAVDTVVLVTAKDPNNSLYKDLEGQVTEIYLVGDCSRAVSAAFAIGEAVRDGHRVGRRL